MNIYQKEFKMDPKVKAAFIVISYLTIVGQDPYTGIQKAIDCAVQSIDQVIEVLNPEDFGIEMNTISDMKNYWNEVKQEILNYGKDK
jgi:hypothetical protein